MARRREPKAPHKPRQQQRIRPRTAAATLTEAVVDPIALDMMAEQFHNEIDETIKEGLRRAIEFSGEYPNGGALTSYIATMRPQAIEAIKVFVTVNPLDSDEIIRLQQIIGDYIRPMQYLVDVFAPISKEAAEAAATSGHGDEPTVAEEFDEATDSET